MIATQARAISRKQSVPLLSYPSRPAKVALQGYCLGALLAFITAARHEVDAADTAVMVPDGKNTSAQSAETRPPCLVHLGEEDEFISKTAQAQIKAALAKKPNATVYSYPGQRLAFFRHNNGLHYNATAAMLAGAGRTSEFLNQYLR